MTSESLRLRFEREVMPHLGAAYNLARWLLGNSHDAEDVAQEAMLRAFRFFNGFRGDNAKAWLLTIARNTCMTWLEQHRRDARTIPLEAHDRSLSHAEPLQSAADDPEAAWQRQANRDLVKRGMAGLPVEFREVLILRELDGLTYKEIGAIANIPLGTVMSRLSRGRSLLKEVLTAGGIKESHGG